MSTDALLADLTAEHEALAAVVAPLTDAQWDLDTPAERWRVRDQIGHLAFFDEQGTIAAAEPERFTAELEELLKDLAAFGARTEAIGRELTGEPLLTRWHAANVAMRAALEAVPDGTRLPWYGPTMSLRSFVTARLMETWAHGTDVVDGLAAAGVPAARDEGDRIAHICHLGTITRGWSYTVRGREAPAGDVRVELTLPSGAPWAAGPDGAAESVRGDAVDFCLVVTQRRNFVDTNLAVNGALAEEWMSIAQCFAGGPTLPPPRRTPH